MSSSNIQTSDITDRDLRPLAALHLAAYRGYMNAGIGRRYVEHFLQWFMRNPSRVALKAELDGAPAGYVVGCPLADHSLMNSDLLFDYALGAITHPWVLLRRQYRKSAEAKLKRIFARKRSVEKPMTFNDGAERGIALTSIAVGPQFGGKGVGQALMLAFEERARTMDYHLARLSVYADNARARAVYEKTGWEVWRLEDRVVYYQKPLVPAGTKLGS